MTPPPSAIPSDERACWATLMTSEHLLPGLVVFADSLLRTHASRYPLVVMTTSKLSHRALAVLAAIRNVVVRPVEPIYPQLAGTHLATPRFGEVWTKLRVWDLDEYDRVVLVDSDMLVTRNMDELMLDDTVFAPHGAPDKADQWIASSFACTCNPNRIKTYPDDWIPANCGYTPQSHPSALTSPLQPTASSPPTHRLINSGLVVLRPDSTTLRRMIERINTDPRVVAYRFPDQDFLADWFEDRVKILPWTYNALKKLKTVHPNIWRDQEVRNVHYILDKPWKLGRPGTPANPKDIDAEIHSWWWDAFDRLRQPARYNSKDGSFAISSDDWRECVESYVTLSLS
ncbi:uncharacterized protein PFL1_04119 [Pseudozyma flocculosa PF-1]|uniref:Related to galactinol synthase n=2 Tax=Pseudozyma flocculosa TaxID=84751 RepID=A0A5C3EVC1_9BASI|nr:uncharacterized protein PFL1_04119 [Pseudozyma flocculosa PF-1]EPQ28292.1 hypothetical protein PFL1_04119 [Pseudozyma flocculosa PF-1]SPO35437.1 related to galactinol synthase [Pseudozyma flocculosa]